MRLLSVDQATSRSARPFSTAIACEFSPAEEMTVIFPSTTLDDVSDLTSIRRESNLADPLGMRHGIKYGGSTRRLLR